MTSQSDSVTRVGEASGDGRRALDQAREEGGVAKTAGNSGQADRQDSASGEAASEGNARLSEGSNESHDGGARVEANRTVVRDSYSDPEFMDYGAFAANIRWMPGGSEIIFGVGSRIYSYSIGGDRPQLRLLVDTAYNFWKVGGHYQVTTIGWPAAMFDISKDGSKMVYADLEFRSGQRPRHVEPRDLAYALKLMDLANGETRQLEGGRTNALRPAWSPDGTRVAYLAGGRPEFGIRARVDEVRIIGTDGQETTTAVAASDLAMLASTNGVRIVPEDHQAWKIAWSPDGTEIAVAVRVEGGETSWALLVAGGDGDDVRHLGYVNSTPSWSPDGQRLAFARGEGNDMAIFTIARDGTDARRVATVRIWDSSPRVGEIFNNPRSNVFWTFDDSHEVWGDAVTWSPDGSQILFSCGLLICVVAADGTEVGRSGFTRRDEPHVPLRASEWMPAWSPDGSRIALVRTEIDSQIMVPPARFRDDEARFRDVRGRRQFVTLFTMAPDGGDVRILAATHFADGSVTPTGIRDTPNVAGCGSGNAVPDPTANAGLVEDCETLLKLRDALAGTAWLDWSAERPIADWEGIVLGGSPARVHEVNLRARGLTGRIPSDIGRLTELRALYVGVNLLGGTIPPAVGNLTKLQALGAQMNLLSGEIPSEFGNLSQLMYLNLNDNLIQGNIPSDLGRLERLQGLWLGGNRLAGSIPIELTQLDRLMSLWLGHNQLTGPIPTALSELTNLREFSISQNQFTGPIPAALGALVNLRKLSISYNQLTGPIPEQFGELTELEELHIAGNQLAGCMSPSLRQITGVSGRLPECDSADSAK